MIKAKFIHKDKFGRGELPIDLTRVEFSGDEEIVEALNGVINAVQFDRSRLCDYEQGFLCEQRMEKLSDINAVRTEMYNLQKSRRFPGLKIGATYARYKELSDKLAFHEAEEQRILGSIEDLEEGRFYSREELRARFAKILRSMGFECREATTDKRGITTESMESIVPDDEMRKIAAYNTTLLARDLDSKKQAIRKMYLGDMALESTGEMTLSD